MPRFTPFLSALIQEIPQKLSNNFKDNIDFARYPNYSIPVKTRIRLVLARLLGGIGAKSSLFQKVALFPIYPFLSRLSSFYDSLADEQSKNLLIDLSLYRALGPSKIKLALNNSEYWDGVKYFESLIVEKQFLDLSFMNRTLHLHNLDPVGFPIQLYINSKGAFTTFQLAQYEYITDGVSIGAQDGETVLDLGGCFGDTALYFSHKVGNSGAVYSFEFIPNNIAIFNKNLGLNKNRNSNIEIVNNPVWDTSGKKVYFKDNGPGSKVTFSDFQDKEGIIETLSIDDFCVAKKIQPDFIKMDIEGAELPALKGAENIIKRYRPKLGISIYHGMNDFVGIVEYLKSLDLSYIFYIKHNTIHKEETVLFAEVNRD